MRFLPYSVFFLVAVTISICVWLAVAKSNSVRNDEDLKNLEKIGELVFVHVVCDFI